MATSAAKLLLLGFLTFLSIGQATSSFNPADVLDVDENFRGNGSAGGRKYRPKVLLSGELERWNEVTAEAKQKGYSLAGFYHTSAWQTYYKEVIQEQVLLMDGRRPVSFFEGPYPSAHHPIPLSTKTPLKTGNITWTSKVWASVLNYADSLFINVAGGDKEDLQKIKKIVDDLDLMHKHKIEFNFNKTCQRGQFLFDSNDQQRNALLRQPELSEGESSTTMKMHSYCTKEKKAGRKALVFYVHSKGACCNRPAGNYVPPPDDRISPVSSWRELMNTFNLEFPSICMRAMLDGYSTCGVELQMGHFSGNFFWANCDHIASLPVLENRFDPWSVEFYPHRVSQHLAVRERYAENCGYSMHKCRGVNHYDRQCPRKTYRKKVMDYVQHRDLPHNQVATSGPKVIPNDAGSLLKHKQWVAETCGEMRQRDYEDSVFWAGGEDKLPFNNEFRDSEFAKGAN